MKEDFLHYLWKFKLLNNLTTTEGDPVQVIKCGDHNKDSGPDFFNARVKIGNTTWAGNVEIHINASDWTAHGHQHDKSYQNIILHVIYEEHSQETLHHEKKIPVIVIKNKFKREYWNVYEKLLKSKDEISCTRMFETIDDFTISKWTERMLIERIEQRIIFIQDLLMHNKQSWEETFYQALGRNFGFKLNAIPFEILATSLPLKYLGKHKNNLLQIESMLFGQAGFLEETFKDNYPKDLTREYLFLKNKFDLKPIEKHLWKFARSRPVNFPTIRLAQFAKLIHQSSHLFSVILETKKIKELYKLFDVSASDYWNTHYNFDKESKRTIKNLGKSSVENILINTIVPFLFFYGKQKSISEIRNRALEFLEQIPGEKNAITRQWQSLKVETGTAYHTQALIQLKNEYCQPKKCLNCGIGNKILTSVAK